MSNYCPPDVKDTKYKLNSIIIHEGTMNGGHYLSIGKRKKYVGF